jgi:hypothetical protein
VTFLAHAISSLVAIPPLLPTLHRACPGAGSALASVGVQDNRCFHRDFDHGWHHKSFSLHISTFEIQHIDA